MNLKRIILALLLLFYVAGCELIDPTEVENPSITDESLLDDATGGAEPLIAGIRYSFADAIGVTTVYTDVTSDNYENISTFISTIIDYPRQITPNEQYLNDTREIYFELQTIHAKTLFGLNIVLPADAEATGADYATVYFYKAMALVMLSENFWAFPIEENGTVITAEEALNTAVSNLQTSLEYDDSPENAVRVQYALARAYRLLGNSANAVTAAEAALALDNAYVFYAMSDEINLLNNVQTFTVARQSSNDMQPLPSLDFLDPKYVEIDSDIPSLKAEEAYLILAEAALASGNTGEAKTQMKNAIDLAKSRPVDTYVDPDPRGGRPDTSSVAVKYTPDGPAVQGLIQSRDEETVNVYPISYTHLTTGDIDAMTTDPELWRALYMLRQEIFFLEGRRMSDLGIRLPVMLQEIDANPNVVAGGPGTYVQVPNYIPPGNEMDQFTYDAQAGVVTLKHDMNAILAENINEVSPFK